MPDFFSRKDSLMIRKTISAFLVVTFSLSMVVTPSQAQLLANLPVPGQMVGLTAGFQPPILRGMTVHPENPLLFDFIVDRGQDKINNELLKDESTKLIKYFLASMTIPDKDAWVNLSPYEKDRIIPDALGQTEMGRQMLEQDYMLKQLSSSLTNPDEELGQKFWKEVKARAQKQFGTTEIPLNTFNKVWIMPDGATGVEKDGFAYITESKLKVMLDEDYVAMSNQKDSAKSFAPGKDVSRDDVSKLSSDVYREMILPQLVKEINEGKNFAQTRQVYQSVILAAWYKKALKDSLLGRIYADKSKVEGVESDVKDIKQKVYEQYLEAFKKGAYNFIKDEENGIDGELIPRKYFSGGQTFEGFSPRVSSSAVDVKRAVGEVNSGAKNLQLTIVAANVVESRQEEAAVNDNRFGSNNNTAIAQSTLKAMNAQPVADAQRERDRRLRSLELLGQTTRPNARITAADWARAALRSRVMFQKPPVALAPKKDATIEKKVDLPTLTLEKPDKSWLTSKLNVGIIIQKYAYDNDIHKVFNIKEEYLKLHLTLDANAQGYFDPARGIIALRDDADQFVEFHEAAEMVMRIYQFRKYINDQWAAMPNPIPYATEGTKLLVIAQAKGIAVTDEQDALEKLMDKFFAENPNLSNRLHQRAQNLENRLRERAQKVEDHRELVMALAQATQARPRTSPKTSKPKDARLDVLLKAPSNSKLDVTALVEQKSENFILNIKKASAIKRSFTLSDFLRHFSLTQAVIDFFVNTSLNQPPVGQVALTPEQRLALEVTDEPAVLASLGVFKAGNGEYRRMDHRTPKLEPSLQALIQKFGIEIRTMPDDEWLKYNILKGQENGYHLLLGLGGPNFIILPETMPASELMKRDSVVVHEIGHSMDFNTGLRIRLAKEEDDAVLEGVYKLAEHYMPTLGINLRDSDGKLQISKLRKILESDPVWHSEDNAKNDDLSDSEKLAGLEIIAEGFAEAWRNPDATDPGTQFFRDLIPEAFEGRVKLITTQAEIQEAPSRFGANVGAASSSAATADRARTDMDVHLAVWEDSWQRSPKDVSEQIEVLYPQFKNDPLFNLTGQNQELFPRVRVIYLQAKIKFWSDSALGLFNKGFLTESRTQYLTARNILQSLPSGLLSPEFVSRETARVDEELAIVELYQRPFADPGNSEAYSPFLTTPGPVNILHDIERPEIFPDVRVTIVQTPAVKSQDQASILFIFQKGSDGYYRLAGKAKIDLNNREISLPITATFIKGQAFMERAIHLLIKSQTIERWVSDSNRKPAATAMYERMKRDYDNGGAVKVIDNEVHYIVTLDKDRLSNPANSSAASSALITTSSGKTMAEILSTTKFASPAKAKGRLLWLVKPYPKNKKLETEYANMSDDQLAAQLIGFIESGFLYQQVFLDHKEDLRAAGLRGFLNLLAVEDYKSEYYNFINDVVNDFIGNLLGKEPGSTGWLGSTEAERKEFYKAKAALKTLFERSGVNTQVLLNMTFAIDRSPGMIEIEVGDIIYSELSAKPSDTNSAFAIMTRLLNIMQTPQSPVSKSDLSSLYSNPTLQKDKIDQTLRELEIVEDETNRDLYKLSPALQAVLAPHIQSIQTIIAQDNDTNRKMGLASSALEFKTELARSLVATIRMKGPEAIAQFEAFYTLYTQGLFKENPDVVLTAITRTPTTIRITLQRNFLALRQAQADTASGEFKEVLQIATEILSQPNPSRNKLTESGRSYLNLIGAANMFDGLFPQIEEIFDNQFKSTAIIFRLNEVGKNTFTVLPIASNEMSFVREVTDQSEAQNTLLHDATMKYLGIIRGILKNNRTGEEFEGYAFVDGDRGHIGNWDRFIKQLVDRNIVTVASSASTPVGDSTESLFTELQILRDRMLPEALGDGYSPERLALQESRRATARLLNNPLDPGYEAALQTISKSGENNSFPVEVLRRSHYDDTINVIWVPREDYDQFNPSKSPAFFNREFAFSPVGGKLLLAIHEHRHSEAELLHPGIESEIDAYMGSLAELIELAGLGLRQAQEEVTNLAQPQNQYEQDLAAQYSGDINRQAIVIYAARVRVYLMGPSYRLLRKNMSRDLSTMDRDGIFNIMTIVTEMMLRDPMNYKKEEIRKQLTFLINRGYKEFFGFLGKYAEYFGPELKLLRWDDEHPFYERFRRIVLSRATTSSGSSNGSAVSSGVITSISTSVPITANPGGIDFDPSKLNLQIKRDGRGVPLPLPQQNLETIDIKGLYPVIINIQPINAQTLPILSQIDNPEPTVLSKS
jgi:hypothetical protein